MTLCWEKEGCCTATPTNQSSANMHFSNTLGWRFEMINVCKNPRGAGGFHFVAHGLWCENIWRFNLGGPTKGNNETSVWWGKEASLGFYIKVTSLSILLVSIICDKFLCESKMILAWILNLLMTTGFLLLMNWMNYFPLSSHTFLRYI